eukprot:CAMPEP_0114559692 /NCGR_PEP_ID=MMETSP0114-20121206/11057_1 /TAXON_ID=31324 /ORGANISM="Goniomonas sp, Strain m" /LENGTH=808 /DNA_ID=CAMNT_0001745179 /DNA_START=6 /DNA_END=2428 /DNA_ORIENTATION=+
MGGPQDDEKKLNDCSSFFAAVAKGDTDEVTWYLDQGWMPNTVDVQGASALHVAALHGHRDIMEILIAGGADTNLPDLTHRTPMHDACMSGKVAVVQVLLESGALIDPRDMWQRLPLHDASQNGHQFIVGELLTRGSDPECRDRVGKTALDYAKTPAVRAVFKAAIPRHKRKAAKAAEIRDASAPKGLQINWAFGTEVLKGHKDSYIRLAEIAEKDANLAKKKTRPRPTLSGVGAKLGAAVSAISASSGLAKMLGAAAMEKAEAEKAKDLNNIDFVKARLEEAEEELVQMKRDLDHALRENQRLEGVVASSVDSEMALRQEVAQLYMKLAVGDQKMKSLEAAVDKAESEMAAKQMSFDDLKSQVDARVVELDALRLRFDELDAANRALVSQYEIYRHANAMGKQVMDPQAIAVKLQKLANNCLLRGLDFKHCSAGKRVKCTLQVFDESDTRVTEGGHTITMTLKGPGETVLQGTVVDNDDGTYDLFFKPRVAGRYIAEVFYESYLVRGCPKEIECVAGKVSASNCMVQGLIESARAGTPFEIVIMLLDRYGNSSTLGGETVGVTLNNDKAMLNEPHVKNQGNGMFRVESMFRDAGTFSMDIIVNGKPAAKSPYAIVVKPGPPLPEQCTAAFKSTAAVFHPGNRELLVVHLRDMFGNTCSGGDFNLQAKLEGMSVGEFKDCGDGQYLTEVNFSASRGVCHLDVTLFGKSIRGCPFSVQVETEDNMATYARLGIDPVAEVAKLRDKIKMEERNKAGEAAEKRRKELKKAADAESVEANSAGGPNVSSSSGVSSRRSASPGLGSSRKAPGPP